MRLLLVAQLLLIVVFIQPSTINGKVDAQGTFTQPWESRPYQILVWVCSDNPPDIAATLSQLELHVARRAELSDPSAWNVTVKTAPGTWRSRLLAFFNEGGTIEGLAEAEELAGFDKLIAVCLSHQDGAIRYRVREFDVQTGQWGALLDRRSPQSRDLAANVFEAIQRVFMPLARIDRVSDEGKVFVRARALNACVQGDIYDGSISAIENSPVWVRPDDRFLPIIRKVDRNGDLAELEPIPFTFLTVQDQSGSRLVCEIHSRQRSALGGRSSKRAQKLALVIRPPESPTMLKLESLHDPENPLAGYEIYSRSPAATADEESEFLGLTNWLGMIEVPPSEEGIRLIYVKRGNRALMKVPIIPGLYDQVVTAVPDDEARLNAEGIAQGFQIEILNLVAQRELFQSRIKAAIKKQEVDDARMLFQMFQRLESPQDLKIRLANEESRLKNSTMNQRERERVSDIFQQLLATVNTRIDGSLESELQAALQNARSTGSQVP